MCRAQVVDPSEGEMISCTAKDSTPELVGLVSLMIPLSIGSNVGSRRVNSARRRGPALGVSLENGKIASSKTTSLEI